MYFVVETKGTINTKNPRTTESDKVECGRNHFKALDSEISFDVTNNLNKILMKLKGK
jgi:type III restriction enzyme